MPLLPKSSESRRVDDEPAAIAAERIRSGAADHKEDGAEALAKLGIEIPAEAWLKKALNAVR